jgi:hypothetical protein
VSANESQAFLLGKVRHQRPTIRGQLVAVRDASANPFTQASEMTKGTFRPLSNLVSFKFRQDREHAEHHFPGGGRCVDSF